MSLNILFTIIFHSDSSQKQQAKASGCNSNHNDQQRGRRECPTQFNDHNLINYNGADTDRPDWSGHDSPAAKSSIASRATTTRTWQRLSPQYSTHSLGTTNSNGPSQCKQLLNKYLNPTTNK